MSKLRSLLKTIRDTCKGFYIIKPYGMTLYFAGQLERDIEVGSILCDLTYGSMFDTVQQLKDEPAYGKLMDALEQLYVVADIGTLASDHIERERKEKAWMIRKGYRT